MSKENYIIPVFVPHFGCPHDCVFCNQQEITGYESRVAGREVRKIINEYLTTIPADADRIEVAFYGGSFTAIEKSYQQELLEAAAEKLSQGQLTGIRLSTRPDYIDEEVLAFLKDFGVTTVELGVQSLDEEVLKRSGRGHTASEVAKASKLIKKRRFKLGLQIMPGLPGSSRESDLITARKVIELQPDFIRIYPTLVIKNTQLAKLYQEGKYSPLSLEEAVELTAVLLKLFNKAQIPVIRIGLQPSEGVNKTEVLAGPFHPSFRQLVESKLMLEKIIKIIKPGIKKLIIIVNPRDISTVRGQKNKNIKFLKEEYNLEEVKVKADKKLSRGEIKIN